MSLIVVSGASAARARTLLLGRHGRAGHFLDHRGVLVEVVLQVVRVDVVDDGTLVEARSPVPVILTAAPGSWTTGTVLRRPCRS
jgi:hypothetical protein